MAKASPGARFQVEGVYRDYTRLTCIGIIGLYKDIYTYIYIYIYTSLQVSYRDHLVCC